MDSLLNGTAVPAGGAHHATSPPSLPCSLKPRLGSSPLLSEVPSGALARAQRVTEKNVTCARKHQRMFETSNQVALAGAKKKKMCKGEMRQMKCHSPHLLPLRAVLQNGLFCGGSLLLRLHLPTLEPGAASSHPGNVRRQEPPRRRQLGHPIRRKSESSLAMAGPAANDSHLLRPPPPPPLPPPSGDTFPLTPAQCASPPCSILYRQSQTRLGVGKSKPATLRASDRAHRCWWRARWRARARMTDTPHGGFRDA